MSLISFLRAEAPPWSLTKSHPATSKQQLRHNAAPYEPQIYANIQPPSPPLSPPLSPPQSPKGVGVHSAAWPWAGWSPTKETNESADEDTKDLVGVLYKIIQEQKRDISDLKRTQENERGRRAARCERRGMRENRSIR